MKRTLEGALTVLCLRHLHRHPLECGDLPERVILDLLAYNRLEADDGETG